MNDFIEQLMALRSGAERVGGSIADVAKGTFENMGNGQERSQQMLDTNRARNRRLIEKQPGGMRAFQERKRKADPQEEQELFGNPYVNAIRALLGRD